MHQPKSTRPDGRKEIVRITIVQGAFLPVPPLRGGAIEKAWQGLGEAFVKAGHEVTHISRLCDGLPRNEKIRGVSHIRVTGAEATTQPVGLKLRELLYVLRVRKILPPADILITNAFWAPIIYPKEKYGKLYVHVGRFPKGQMKFYNKATRLQAPSQSVGRAISAELSELDDRVRCIPYPLPDFEPHGFPIYDRPKRVLYAGRIHPEKGVLELVQAWLRLPEEIKQKWALRLVGPWRKDQGGGGSRYLQKIRDIGGSNVEIQEPIFDQKILSEEYKNAQVFVYPSMARRGETFGLAVLEAMNCGCVPVVSPLDCFQDFVLPGKNGIFLDQNEKNLVTGLVKTLQNVLLSCPLDEWSKQAYLTTQKYEMGLIAERFLDDFRAII